MERFEAEQRGTPLPTASAINNTRLEKASFYYAAHVNRLNCHLYSTVQRHQVLIVFSAVF